MEEKNNVEKSKKKLGIYYGLLVTVICIIGVSFAWFRLYLSQSEDNTLASRTCFNTTLTEDTSKIELTDAFPISDEDGLKQTPFTFTLKNNCDSYVKVYITIDSTYRESTSSSYLKDNYMKVNVSPKDTTSGASKVLGNQTLTDLENNRKGYILSTAYLNANEEKSFDLRIWMDSETTLDQGLNKNWAGKIVVVSNASEAPAPAPNSWYDAGSDKLLASIRDDNTLETPLTTPGNEVSAYTEDDITDTSNAYVSSTYQAYYFTYGTGWEANGTGFNLTGTAVTSDTYANSYSSLVGKYLVSEYASSNGLSTAGTMVTTTNLKNVYYVVSATSNDYTYKTISSNKNATEALLASTEDDYGTSYYFRGSVKNNYVQFANKCWRIVRITGDGSIKLVLHNDNTSASSSPCSLLNNNTSAAFAHYDGSKYTSKFNVDRYDNAYIGFMYGSAGASDYASAHANTNKSIILTNLETWYTNNLASYESKLADTIWCNDKSTISGELGYGANDTKYSAENRIYSTKQPTFKCPNDNNVGKLSKFTVNDTTNGNGSLDYKIGLLTADEMLFSGFLARNYKSVSYLKENTGDNVWWSLSPCNYYGVMGSAIWSVQSSTILDVASLAAVRPAISLISSITISGGTGTSEDPYVIN